MYMYNIRHFHIITTGEGGGENRRLQHVQNDKVSNQKGGGGGKCKLQPPNRPPPPQDISANDRLFVDLSK